MNLRCLLVFAGVFAADTASAFAQGPQYVGEIIIVGNTQTPDRYIRQHLDFYPGQVLDVDKVRLAERNLAALEWFHIDARTGVRPTVAVLDSPGAYKDIVISVAERPGNWARLALWELALYQGSRNPSHLRELKNCLRIGINEWRGR